jgi:serine protease Do
MKMFKLVGILMAMAGLVVLALVLAPSASGQARGDDTGRALMMLAGRGAEIGVRIADAPAGGVVIEEVQPDSPAEKAGLKQSDVIVEFDGQHVRSARQFGRLVQETPPGRTVKVMITRDGQKKDVQITPSEGRRAGLLRDGDRFGGRLGDLDDNLRELGRLGDHLPPFNFNFDFDMSGALSGRRLGVSVDELSDQLAQYFGAKDGLLVTSVTDGSAASRAGLKAGDVITSINGHAVRSRDDLVRELREANEDEIAIGIVRDKKYSEVKAKIDAPARRNLRGARPASDGLVHRSS